jgi:anti-sigma factor RsiW
VNAPPNRRPTDAELVLFVDGELDAERGAEVASWLAGDEELRGIVRLLRLGGRIVETDALDRADRAGADGIADAVMARIAREERIVARHRLRRAIGAAIVVAAAAAAFVWVRSAAKPEPTAPTAAVAPLPAPHAPGDDPAASTEPTTEIDAVDFGARAGTIFYVPSGAATTTAVVWLSDDDVAETRPDHP